MIPVVASDTSALSGMLESISSVFTTVAKFCGDFLTQLMDNPLTLVMVAIPIIGVGLGFVFKLLRGA